MAARAAIAAVPSSAEISGTDAVLQVLVKMQSFANAGVAATAAIAAIASFFIVFSLQNIGEISIPSGALCNLQHRV